MRTKLFLFFILTLIGFAIFLRIVNLENLPNVMHRDETSMGYNAYSLLLTGHDEHNQAWPISFRAFADYKLPGLIYATIPFVSVLGLTTTAVRLPTALAAVGSLFSAYWLTKEIGLKKRASLLSLLFLCFEFWHISQARTAYEPMVGLLFSTLALASWLRGFKSARWFVVSLFFYAVSIFFYNVPWILLPLLFFGSAVIQRQTLHTKKLPLALASIGVLTIATAFGLLIRDVNASRSGVTIVQGDYFQRQSEQMTFGTLVAGQPSKAARLLQSVPLFTLTQAIEGYAAAFNPIYLYFQGDSNPWHSLRNIDLGNSNPAQLIWVVIGGYAIFQARKEKQNQLLLFFLFASPTVSALTIDAPVTNRLLDFHLFLTMFAGVGADFALQKVTHSKKKKVNAWTIFQASTVCAYLLFFVLFITRYFGAYDKFLAFAWNPQVKELVQETEKVRGGYDKVFVTIDLELGYTYFTFYSKYDPATFSKEAKRYMSGFDHVAQYSNYHFSDFPELINMTVEDMEKLMDYSNDTKVLVIDREVRGREKKDRTGFTLVKEIKDWQGEPNWKLWETDTTTLRSYLRPQLD